MDLYYTILRGSGSRRLVGIGLVSWLCTENIIHDELGELGYIEFDIIVASNAWVYTQAICSLVLAAPNPAKNDARERHFFKPPSVAAVRCGAGITREENACQSESRS